MHGFGIMIYNPVLGNWVPVRDVTACNLVREGSRLARRQGQVVKAAQYNLGVRWAA